MSFLDYTMNCDEMQQVLHENIEKITERMKFKNQIIDKMRGVLPQKQYDDFVDCGKFIGTGTNGRIVTGNFCRNRLCPVCNRRNSAQKWAKMYNVAQRAIIDFRPVFALFTVTVKNVTPENLSDEITQLMKSIDRMHKRSIFKNNVYGFFRSLEITFNADAGTFHPHYHYILALPSDYKNNMISTYEWRTMWEQCARLNYNSQVDIRIVDDENVASACAEIAKYAVKISSVIEQNTDIIKTLTQAIRGRRLISFGGAFKQYDAEQNNERERYDIAENGYTSWTFNGTNYDRAEI